MMTRRSFTYVSDGSIVDDIGRVVQFSEERFVNDICEGDKCFICGASPTDAPFNDEHVFPQWLLRRFGLHDREIVLPNDSEFRYGQYRIQCCAVCNSNLGQWVESPVSEVMAGGLSSVSKHLRSEGRWLLFTWMCLLFLKIHLKDGRLRMHRDLRRCDDRIGDLYDWSQFAHIHSLARAGYAGSRLAPQTLGSLFVVPAQPIEGLANFDYADLYQPSCMMFAWATWRSSQFLRMRVRPLTS